MGIKRNRIVVKVGTSTLTNELGNSNLRTMEELSMALADMQTVEDRYFVRVAGKMPERIAAIREAFGEVETVTVPGLPDEFAFVTAPMSGAAYEKAAAAAGGVLGRIRAAF